VPDDVTIVWPDDNFGYVRNFASAEEQKRSGGFGIYYHISYLGRPMSYLWLCTTPPALIWEEMNKAYVHGAKKIWIVNVGDLKPAEIGTEFFLQMAWDMNRWRRDNLQDFLPEWAAREFGPAHADQIGAIMADYYRWNFTRKPEHLQWWLPGQTPSPSPLTRDEARNRMTRFAALRGVMDRAQSTLPAEKLAAFEQLVGYPVRGAALANARYFLGELGEKDLALAADAELTETTRRFNEELVGGKWRGFMTLEPADGQWKSMRIAPWQSPEFAKGTMAKAESMMLEADRFMAHRANTAGVGWEKIDGLAGVTILPATAPSSELTKLAADAPRLGYEITFPTAGEFTLTTYLLPTHPLLPDRGLRFAVGLDDAPPQLVVCEVKDGSAEWAQGVLNNSVSVSTKLRVPTAGAHALRIYGVDAGVVLLRLEIGPRAQASK
jgi:hypothetical protein